jgi:hypothetical protein
VKNQYTAPKLTFLGYDEAKLALTCAVLPVFLADALAKARRFPELKGDPDVEIAEVTESLVSVVLQRMYGDRLALTPNTVCDLAAEARGE